MRRSRLDTAATRTAIVTAASRLFRSNGISNVSVADVMGSLGLTVGGFYRHFESKDALVAEAIAFASAETTAALASVRARAAAGAHVHAVADFYLARAHRRNRAYGCPVAAFAGEVPHCSAAVRRAFADAHGRLAAVIADAHAVDARHAGPHPPPISVATLVGTLLLGRALGGDQPAAPRSPGRPRAARKRRA
jgi:TetR/AcrR family transcriptional repressor of nem operon